ncbi:MAG: hypothetical protein ACI3ZP_05605 [Candidatus Cryptobacteroides sp.]
MAKIIEQIKQYRKLLKDPEHTIDVYDGRGTIDVYVCDKNPEHRFYTYYKDFGVTPYMIHCKVCRRKGENHFMRHQKTLKCDSDRVRGRLADGYWYRPWLWYFLTHRYEREHLLQGGLILKRLIQWDV